MIWEHNIPRDRKNNVISPGNFIHWRELQQSFDDIAAVGMTFNTTLTGLRRSGRDSRSSTSPRRSSPSSACCPAIGRPFTEAEDRPRARLVVISDRMWKRPSEWRSGDPAEEHHARGESYAVVGVMPPGFSFLDKTVDLWMPVGILARRRARRAGAG